VDRPPLSRTATTVPLTGTTVSHTATAASRTARVRTARISYIKKASERQMPLPDRSLLNPLPEPDCTFRGPLSNPVTAEEMRMKLDYEQQCYRHAEAIVRTRLESKIVRCNPFPLIKPDPI